MVFFVIPTYLGSFSSQGPFSQRHVSFFVTRESGWVRDCNELVYFTFFTGGIKPTWGYKL